jgi:hypothetical protein
VRAGFIWTPSLESSSSAIRRRVVAISLLRTEEEDREST